MRILIATGVTPTLGGVSSHINALSRAVRAAGHEVTIVTPLGIAPEFRAIRPGLYGALAGFLRLPGGMLVAYFASQNMLRVHARRALAARKYDVIHAEDVSAANAVLSLSAARKTPVLLTVHGYLTAEAVADGRIRPNGWEQTVLLGQEKQAYRRARMVTAVAQRLSEHVQQLGTRSDTVAVMPNFVDVKRFHAQPEYRETERSRLNIANDEYVILCPRRLLPQYGAEFLIRALPTLVASARGGRTRLLAAGTGRKAGALKDLASSLGVSSCLTMLGQIPNEQMPRLYAAADVVAIPSVSLCGAVEGTSVAALEAMACGRPVVASAIGGLREVVSHEVTGLLVPERDPGALAAALLLLKDNPALASQLGEAAARYVRAERSSTAAARFFLGLYSAITGDK